MVIPEYEELDVIAPEDALRDVDWPMDWVAGQKKQKVEEVSDAESGDSDGDE